MARKTKVKRHLRRIKKKRKVTVVRKHKRRIKKRKNRGASKLSEMLDKLSKRELERILNRELTMSEIPLTKAQLKKEIKKLDFPMGRKWKRIPIDKKTDLIIEKEDPIDKFTLLGPTEAEHRGFITQEAIQRGKLKRELRRALRRNTGAFPGTCVLCGRQRDLSVLRVCKQCERRREGEAFANFSSSPGKSDVASPRAKVRKGSQIEKILKELEKTTISTPKIKPASTPSPPLPPTKISGLDIDELVLQQLAKARITPVKQKKAEERQKKLQEKFFRRELLKAKRELKVEMEEKLKLEKAKLKEKLKRVKKLPKKKAKKKPLKRKPVKRKKKSKPKPKKAEELKTLAESSFESVLSQLEDIPKVGGRIITKKQKK